jgi:hypothetical protein
MIPWRTLAIALAVGHTGPMFAVAKPTGIRVHVYGAGGPPRGRSTSSPLAGVAVRVTRRADTPVVAQARTGSTGSVTIRLASGGYSINGFLTPPAVIPERRCEITPKQIEVRRGKLTTVSIFCQIK